MKKSQFAGLAGSTVAITALAFAGLAHAANLPMPAPAAPAWVPQWEGYYIGINGGGMEGTTRTGINILNNNVGTPGVADNLQAAGADSSFNNSGSIIGGQFGYMFNLKAPSFFPWGYVSALEVSFDAMSLKGSNATAGILPTAPFAAPGTPPGTFGFNRSVGADWLLLLTERAGFDWGNWFPYATAGFAVASLKYSNTFADTSCTNCPIDASFKKVAFGLAWGAGLEWRWDNHWSLRGEYLYLWFADDVTGQTFPFDFPSLGGSSTFNHHATFGENIGRGALSYRW
jgi:outer membrane immunogenic protein